MFSSGIWPLLTAVHQQYAERDQIRSYSDIVASQQGNQPAGQSDLGLDVFVHISRWVTETLFQPSCYCSQAVVRILNNSDSFFF